MCEIFSAIGTAILGTVGAATASTTAATAVGVAATASTVAGLASTGLGIAGSIRASRDGSNSRSIQDTISKQTPKIISEKTAAQLKENKLSSRTLNSLRIPLKKNVESNANVSQYSAQQTGLNIPT